MTEYTVGLKYIVNSAVGDPVKYVDRLSGKLDQLEARNARSAGRAGQRTEREQHQLNAQAIKSSQQMEEAKRNAAFRRLRDQQREEERFTRYRITLDRRLAREKERGEQQQFQATQRRVREAQQAEAAAHRAGVTRAGARGRLGGEVIGGVAGYAMTGMAVAGAAIGGGAAYTGKQALDTAQELQGARLRLTAILGDEKAANAEIKDMVRIAGKTKFDWQDLVDATSSLSASFGDTNQRRYVIGSISDMVTGAGGGKQMFDQVTLAINQVMGKGKLEQEEVNQIIEPLRGIVSRRELNLEIGRALGLKKKSDQETVTAVQKLQKDGKISGDVAINALLNVGRRKVGSSEAGSFAIKAGGSIEGQLSNIKTGLSTLFAMSDIDQWPAMEALRGILGDISNELIDDNGGVGAFLGILKDVSAQELVPFLNEVRAGLKSLHDPTNESLRDFELFLKGLVSIADVLYTIGKIITYPVVKLIELLGYARELDQLGEKITLNQVGGATKQVGVDAVTGLAEGMKSVVMLPATVGDFVVDNVIGVMRDKLQTHSPSRVMMEIGANTGEGFALGLRGSADRVGSAAGMLPDAATSMMRPRAYPVAGGGMSGGGRPSLSVAFTLPVVTAQDPAELTKQAMPLIMAQFMPTMDRYFGRVAAQGTG